MARHCSVCVHPEVEAMNLELVDGISTRKVAEKYGLSASPMARHKKHLPPELFQPAEVRRASAAIQRIGELDRRVDEIYAAATAGNDPKLALRALKELRQVLETYAKLTGEMQTAAVQNTLILTQAPEWVSTRSAILQALEPYPAARGAVVAALGGPDSVR